MRLQNQKRVYRDQLPSWVSLNYYDSALFLAEVDRSEASPVPLSWRTSNCRVSTEPCRVVTIPFRDSTVSVRLCICFRCRAREHEQHWQKRLRTRRERSIAFLANASTPAMQPLFAGTFTKQSFLSYKVFSSVLDNIRTYWTGFSTRPVSVVLNSTSSLLLLLRHRHTELLVLAYCRQLANCWAISAILYYHTAPPNPDSVANCLSITLLLLSHVPCFVSASRCTAYHAALILMCAQPYSRIKPTK